MGSHFYWVQFGSKLKKRIIFVEFKSRKNWPASNTHSSNLSHIFFTNIFRNPENHMPHIFWKKIEEFLVIGFHSFQICSRWRKVWLFLEIKGSATQVYGEAMRKVKIALAQIFIWRMPTARRSRAVEPRK